MDYNPVHTGKFVEMRTTLGAGGFEYEYLHEHRCDGHVVAFLPHHMERGYLLRHELTPCWGESPHGFHINSFTGGWESAKHATPIDTLIDELREEAGIVLPNENSITSLGTCRGTKSSDNLYHLFAVDLNFGYTSVAVEPDSVLESKEHVRWYKNSRDWIQEGVDPLLFVMYTRLKCQMDRPIDRNQYS